MTSTFLFLKQSFEVRGTILKMLRALILLTDSYKAPAHQSSVSLMVELVFINIFWTAGLKKINPHRVCAVKEINYSDGELLISGYKHVYFCSESVLFWPGGYVVSGISRANLKLQLLALLNCPVVFTPRFLLGSDILQIVLSLLKSWSCCSLDTHSQRGL